MTGLAILILALALGDGAQISTATATRASFVAEPEEVEIGQPVAWILTVPHARRQRVALASDDLLPASWGEAWVVLEGPRIERGDAGDGAHTRISWQVMGLEPSEVTLPAPAVTLDGAEIELDLGSLHVRGELAPSEDAPRPPKGLHAAPPPSTLRPWHVVLVPLIVGFTGLLVWRLRRRRKPPEEPAPRERLDDLARGVGAAETSERVRAFAFELAALLRAAVDSSSRAALPAGLSDEEWLRAHQQAGELSEAEVERLRMLLERCELAKYSGDVPTRFALEEDVEAARHFLDGLEARSVREEARRP